MPTCKIRYNGSIAELSGLDNRTSDILAQRLTVINQTKLRASQSSYSKRVLPIEEYTTVLFDRKLNLIPTGLMSRVVKLLEELEYQVEIASVNPLLKPVDVELPSYLRDYQIAGIKSGLTSPRGIWQMPTGSGKSISAAAFISHFPNAHVLFTVPFQKLAVQTRKVLNEYLKEPVGLVGAGKHEWQRVTVGVVNSLVTAANNKEPALQNIQVHIIDECHFAGSASYLTLTQSLSNVQYAIGLSATPKRNDGCELIMEACCGEITYQTMDEDVANIGAINLPTYIQLPIANRYTRESKPEPSNTSSLNLNEILKLYKYSISQNADRNMAVVKVVNSLLNLPSRQGNILVLFEYIEHGETLVDLLGQHKITAPLVHGKTKKSVATKTVEDFKDLRIPLMVGSRVFKEGIDLPNLEFIVFAGAASSDVSHWQYIGRVLRTNSSYTKTRSVVIDFKDGDNYFGRRSARREQFVIDRYNKSCSHLAYSIPEMLKITESKLA